MQDYIVTSIKNSINVKSQILDNAQQLQQIQQIAELCIAAYKNNQKILLAGNGGSAADAQHIAAEFVSRFAFDRPGLPAIALTTDTSMLTAIGNDYSYDQVFSRQLEANGQNGDVFIAISTSGNSKNIVKALESAKQKGILSIGLTGESGGAMKALCDHCFCVPSSDTARIQESHIVVSHIICGLIENAIFAVEAI